MASARFLANTNSPGLISAKAELLEQLRVGAATDLPNRLALCQWGLHYLSHCAPLLACPSGGGEQKVQVQHEQRRPRVTGSGSTTVGFGKRE